MSKVKFPKYLIAQLKELSYSDKMIRELWKWYDSSLKEGGASY